MITPSSKTRHRRAIGTRTALACLAAATMCSVAATGAVASQARSTAKATKIKPDLSYFAGKSITWIIAQAVGQSMYQQASILAPVIASYLHASINLESIPAGSDIVGQDTLAASPPNALTIGTLSLGTDVTDDLENIPNVNFSLQKQEFIVGLNTSPQIFAACTGYTSQYTSFKQVLDSPTPIPLIFSSAGTEQHAQIVFGAYNTPLKLLPGYASVANEVAGCLRGDAPVATMPLVDVTTTEIQDGVLRPLLVTAPAAKQSIYYPLVKKLPTFASYFAKYKPKTRAGRLAMEELIANNNSPSSVPSVPQYTPKKYVAALTAAFIYAARQKSVIATQLSMGEAPGYLTPPEVLASVRKTIKGGPLIERYFNYGM